MMVARTLTIAAALALSGCATMMSGSEDASRTKELRTELNTDTNLRYVTAQVRGDRAYLSGWAPTYAARYKAETVAAKVPGVTKVYDSMGTGSNDRGTPRG